MSKVLLINPPEKDILEDAGDRPPLGLLYLANSLKKNNHVVMIVDMNHENLIIRDDTFDYIGITFTTPMYERSIELAKELRKQYPNVKLIAGGPHTSADPDSCKEYFDYIVVNEGEQAIIDIVEGRIDSQIVKAKTIEDIDDVGHPLRDMVDMSNYNMMLDDKRTATLISSRGCTGACVYCSRKSLGNTFRAHSTKHVIEEMKILYSKYGYDSFYFLDDTFTFDKKRVLELCEEMNFYFHGKISFRLTTRADKVDLPMLYALKKAGLTIVSLGIEHADNDVLKKSGKGMTIEQNGQVVKWCKQLGIKVKGFFIVNLPGADKDSALKTVEWAIQNKLDFADFYALTAFPGSALWERPESFNMRLLDKDFNYLLTGENINIDSEKFPKEEVLEIVKEVREKWTNQN